MDVLVAMPSRTAIHRIGKGGTMGGQDHGDAARIAVMLSMMPSAWAVMSLPTIFATIAAAAYEKYIPRIGC